MNKEDFIEKLLHLTLNENIVFSRNQAELCFIHVELMLEWNRKHNLTRLTDIDEILISHILDSIIPSRWLPTSGLALDLGTGAGFPGVPLKILNPELHMVLLEANRKKTSFLRVLLSRLKLPNLWALQGRWEDFSRLPGQHPRTNYDLITMRAVRIEPGHLSHFSSKILKNGGQFAWWAGPRCGTDIRDVDASEEGSRIEFLQECAYNLPMIETPRHLVAWRKLI